MRSTFKANARILLPIYGLFPGSANGIPLSEAAIHEQIRQNVADLLEDYRFLYKVC